LDSFELNESRHWSDEEHLRFLRAIQKFGHKQVEAIATNFVGQKQNFVAPGGHVLEDGHAPSVNDPQTLWQEKSAHFAGAHPPPVSHPQTEFANAQEPTSTWTPRAFANFSSDNSGEGRGREVKQVEQASKPQPQGLCSAEPVVVIGKASEKVGCSPRRGLLCLDR
jgi:hypothetical protein